MIANEKQFQDYFVGRRGIYHNKPVVILSVYYDVIEYQDFGFDFDNFNVILYFEDGSKKTVNLKGNQIKKNIRLLDIEKKMVLK